MLYISPGLEKNIHDIRPTVGCCIRWRTPILYIAFVQANPAVGQKHLCNILFLMVHCHEQCVSIVVILRVRVYRGRIQQRFEHGDTPHGGSVEKNAHAETLALYVPILVLAGEEQP
jgi:hypothetical protein